MSNSSVLPRWLEWARELQGLAQTGLCFSTDVYDRERYSRLLEVATEIAAAHLDEPPERVRVFFGHDQGYTTPKVDVRGGVFQDGKLLLVRERADGLWTLPGGWADVTESPAQAIEREVFEESGFRVKAEKLAAFLDRDRHNHPPLMFKVYKAFFICRITGGAAAASAETEEVQFFDPQQLPALSTTRTTPGQVALLFEHLRDSSRPCDFD